MYKIFWGFLAYWGGKPWLCKMFGLVNKKKKKRNARAIPYYISNTPKQSLLTQGVRAIKTLF